MAFQPTENGCKVVMPLTQGSFSWSNHMWFSKVGFSNADMVALCDLIHNRYYTYLDGYMNDATRYGPPTAYDMRTSDGAVVVGTQGDSAGEGADDPLPVALACVVTLRTAKRGRAHRGRLYIAGFGETSQTDGILGSGLQSACWDFAGSLISGAATLGWTFGVRSGQLDGVLRETAIIEPVTSVEVRSGKPGSQRRRTARG